MISNKFLAGITFFSFTLMGVLNAHDLWIGAVNPKVNTPLSIHFGYGHNFPAPEVIPPERLSVIFDEVPVKIYSPKGDVEVQKKSGGQNYDFVTKSAVGNGTYIITGKYNPTFWSTDTKGKWHMGKLRADLAEPASCQESNMESKSVISFGKTDVAFVTKPVGQKLEIVPLKDPNGVKGGEALPVQVLFKGEPLPNVKVNATFDTFGKDAKNDANTHNDRPLSFQQSTDHDGKVDIYTYPKKGYYIVLVSHKVPYSDPAKCDNETFRTTLTFKVAK